MHDGVDAGTVEQAGVDHGRGLVDAPADLGHDLVDDAPKVVLVDELGGDGLDLAGALHVDAVGAVDHDFGDLTVLEVAVDGAVAEDVVGDVLDELGLVGRRQRGLLLGQRLLQLVLHADAQVVLTHAPVVEERTELVDEVVVDLLPQLVEHRIPAARPRGRADFVQALG